MSNRKQQPKLARKGLVSFGAAALMAMTAATAQVAGGTPGASGIDATGNYRSEVEACRSGRTQQDVDTCLREARNAQAERRSGTLRLQDQPDYQANAMARCEPLTGEDKAACKARVMGYGNTTGSVAGGGILREVETVVMPPGEKQVTIEPKTDEPVVLVPMPAQRVAPSQQ